MGQRVMIAMMVVREPDLLIADEPTSALDVSVRNQVLSILDELVTRRGMGLIFISHDLNLVSQVLRPGHRHVRRPHRRNPRGRPPARGAHTPIRAASSPAFPRIDGSLEPLAGAAARSHLGGAAP